MINPYQTEEFFAGAIDIVAYILRTAERTQGAGVWCEFLTNLQRQLLGEATKMGFGFNADLRKAADAHDAKIRQETARDIIKLLSANSVDPVIERIDGPIDAIRGAYGIDINDPESPTKADV